VCDDIQHIYKGHAATVLLLACVVAVPEVEVIPQPHLLPLLGTLREPPLPAEQFLHKPLLAALLGGDQRAQGAYGLVPSTEGGGDAALFGIGRPWPGDSLESFQAEVLLYEALGSALYYPPELIERILDEEHICDVLVGGKAENTIRKASIEAEDSALRNVRRDGDAECTLGPELALCSSCFGVGLRVCR